jgi:phosphomannomutase
MQQALPADKRRRRLRGQWRHADGQQFHDQRQDLRALPTRDCFLPMLATLSLAAEKAAAVGDRLGLPPAFAAADRLENFPSKPARLMAHLRASPDNLAAFLQPIGTVGSASDIDGLRVTLADRRIIHFRPSGNAPEMRCYVEAETDASATDLLATGLGAHPRMGERQLTTT